MTNEKKNNYEITTEMVEAAVDVFMRRYLEIENPENLSSLCAEALREAMAVRRKSDRVTQ